MNTQCSTTVSLTDSSVPLSRPRHQRRRLNQATQPSRRRQTASEAELNAAAFERFLYWMGPDPETAGRKYESIRGRLIMMFRARRCVFAEDLADATFERVARKMNAFTTEFTGDPARYFYGVAKKIYLEHQRKISADRRRSQSSFSTNSADQEMEKLLEQLDEALNTIPKSDRELILRYYTGSGKNKIDYRRALAEQFALGPGALRLRVFRIRKEIKNHMSR